MSILKKKRKRKKKRCCSLINSIGKFLREWARPSGSISLPLHRRQQLIDTGRPRLIKLAAFPKSIIAGSISRFPRPATNRNAAPLEKKVYTRFSNRSAATFDRSIQPRLSIRCQLPPQVTTALTVGGFVSDFSRIIYACLSRIGWNSFRLILRAFFSNQRKN